jgi:hypothetical protein
MRLDDFIVREMEPILAQWEAFAGTLLPAAASMKPLGLRDHAEQILRAVAKDLSTFQTRMRNPKNQWGEPLNWLTPRKQRHKRTLS